jgi:hypothetical protein
MNRNLKTGSVVLVAAVAFAVGGTGSAIAARLITGDDIARNTITQRNLADDSVGKPQLKSGVLEGVRGPAGPAGQDGTDGKDGKDGLVGAYYSVAFYDMGDTNAGAIATVACKAETDTAISGGVQTIGLDDTPGDNNTPVSSSFPGRMDWSTNTPKADRLDGWIVQFGGNAGEVSDRAPERVKVWALCVPGASIPIEQTFLQSQ